jgi:hypothetical protein
VVVEPGAMVLISVEIAYWRRAFEWEIERARHFYTTDIEGVC